MIGIRQREVDHLGAVGRDRERRDHEIGFVGLQHRDARWAGRGDDLEFHAEILGEQPRGIDVRSRRLHLVVGHAEGRDRCVDGDPDLAGLPDVVERVGVRDWDERHQGDCDAREQMSSWLSLLA